MTQANGSSTGRTDDNEEDFVLPRRPVRLASQSLRGRNRSSSLTLGHHGRVEGSDNISVLRSIQLQQARSKRTVASALPNESSPLVHSEATISAVADEDAPASARSPARSRRNSTSSIEGVDLSAHDIPPPPVPPQLSVELNNTDPSAPQTTTTPTSPKAQSHPEESNPVSQPGTYALLHEAYQSGSLSAVNSAVDALLRSPNPPSTIAEYNMAIQALAETRQPLGSLQSILDVYNAALDRGLVPNVRTYKYLIIAMCERDREVRQVINTIETRMKRRGMLSSNGLHSSERQMETERQELEQLDAFKREDNFRIAVRFFDALVQVWGSGNKKVYSALNYPIYAHLMRSCAYAADIDVAIRVFSHLERSHDGKPTTALFHSLMRTYIAAGDIEGAEAVFTEYKRQSQEGLLPWDVAHAESEQVEVFSLRPNSWHRGVTLHLWNDMINGYFNAKQPVKAISLLEEMLDSSANADFGPTDIPPPCIATFTTFINGFIRLGDVDSALTWFERMLAQPPTPRDPSVEGLSADEFAYVPLKTIPRPNEYAWNGILTALADRNMAPQLNKVYKAYVASGLPTSSFDSITIAHANIRYVRLNPNLPKDQQSEMLAFARQLTFGLERILPWQRAVEEGVPAMSAVTNLVASLSMLLTDVGRSIEGLEVLEEFARVQKEDRRKSDQDTGDFRTRALRKVVHEVIAAASQSPNLGLGMAIRLCRLGDSYDITRPIPIAQRLMQAYYNARDANAISGLGPEDWDYLNRVARSVQASEYVEIPNLVNVQPLEGFVFRGYKEFLRDWAAAVPESPLQIRSTSKRIAHGLVKGYGARDAAEFIKELGKDWNLALASEVERCGMIEKIGDVNVQHPTTSPTMSEGVAVSPSEAPNVIIDLAHGRFVDEYFPAHPRITPEVAWSRYTQGVSRGYYPPADVIGRLIQTFGRKGDLQRVHQLYRDGQAVLSQMDDAKQLQSYGWYAIEDQMIIALAHAGDIEGAHVHRQRIIDQGGTPTSDAYGALIQCVKETTDDSSNALALWQESQTRGVVPNMYLYNTIISKLSKARKADLALELFQQMKLNHIRPSSVTFGAVIAACCRVGDAQSAEVLFQEMTSQQNFKPRIPPYNTMIQFYTHIMRDRERALYYFGELLRAGIQPTAHTYKVCILFFPLLVVLCFPDSCPITQLLIDCYGTIEPVDTASMEDVFARLVSDRAVQVQGVHWAALINSYGCVKKDLNKAVEVFDSIPTHASTQRSKLRLPDAVTYESMINVLVTLRRTDLMPEYLERLTSSGVHMTAYIANLLIKGFAANGNLERARDIFESLSDPPVGVAAPGNHQPHEVTPGSVVAPGAPVYREVGKSFGSV